MIYTVCVTLPNDYYTITHINEGDVKFIASAFMEQTESFFFSGRKYDIKDIRDFQIFAYESIEKWSAEINGSKETLGEGVFKGKFVFFQPHSLSRHFSNVTNNFINKYSNAKDFNGPVDFEYINPARINGLRSRSNSKFDLGRLVKICEEINISFSARCYLATVFLVRALLDHVPPIFGLRSFSEVANNYGGKSFKEAMLNLENSSRKIADLYLHTQVKSHEVLPVEQQVNFSPAVDLLLAEVIQLTKATSP